MRNQLVNLVRQKYRSAFFVLAVLALNYLIPSLPFQEEGGLFFWVVMYSCLILANVIGLFIAVVLYYHDSGKPIPFKLPNGKEIKIIERKKEK